MKWIKIPSIISGGKPHFYKAYDEKGNWKASVVWNRSVKAYAVEVNPGKLIGYVKDVKQGIALATSKFYKKITPLDR